MTIVRTHTIHQIRNAHGPRHTTPRHLTKEVRPRTITLKMSINWVMMQAGNSREIPFVPLPNETIEMSAGRVGMQLTSGKGYPGNTNTDITSSTGTIYLTSSRILYLPDHASAEFKSFAAPIKNLHDAKIVQPWFGPNAWVTEVTPVHAGGLMQPTEAKLTFKDGGVFDFHMKFSTLRHNIHEGIGAHAEDLPAYQEEPPLYS